MERLLQAFAAGILANPANAELLELLRRPFETPEQRPDSLRSARSYIFNTPIAEFQRPRFMQALGLILERLEEVPLTGAGSRTALRNRMRLWLTDPTAPDWLPGIAQQMKRTQQILPGVYDQEATDPIEAQYEAALRVIAAGGPAEEFPAVLETVRRFIELSPGATHGLNPS